MTNALLKQDDVWMQDLFTAVPLDAPTPAYGHRFLQRLIHSVLCPARRAIDMPQVAMQFPDGLAASRLVQSIDILRINDNIFSAPFQFRQCDVSSIGPCIAKRRCEKCFLEKLPELTWRTSQTICGQQLCYTGIFPQTVGGAKIGQSGLRTHACSRQHSDALALAQPVSQCLQLLAHSARPQIQSNRVLAVNSQIYAVLQNRLSQSRSLYTYLKPT